MKIDGVVLAELRYSLAQADLALAQYESDRDGPFSLLDKETLDRQVEHAQQIADQYAAIVTWAEAQT
jgi:hypothetical protein